MVSVVIVVFDVIVFGLVVGIGGLIIGKLCCCWYEEVLESME